MLKLCESRFLIKNCKLNFDNCLLLLLFEDFWNTNCRNEWQNGAWQLTIINGVTGYRCLVIALFPIHSFIALLFFFFFFFVCHLKPNSHGYWWDIRNKFHLIQLLKQHVGVCNWKHKKMIEMFQVPWLSMSITKVTCIFKCFVN